jgi:hypothetical protein
MPCDKTFLSLQKAEEADPSYLEIYELRAKCAANGGIDGFKNAIKDLARHDHAQPKALGHLPRMAKWLQQPAFNEFMTDLLGDNQIEQLRQLANYIDMAGDFIDVPAGCFTVKNKEVCLDAFRIGKYEVTQRQYKGIIGSNPSHFSSCDDCPVENVNWYNAQLFIDRLKSMTGNSYRLPTEAEWEYACRSGGRNEEYCGGADIDAVAWYKENSEKQTHPVGLKHPNGLGIYDMSGNVTEWVNDWYELGNYPSSGNNPHGPSSGSNRVLRGGGWSSWELDAKSMFCTIMPPEDHSDRIGFRLVSSVP